MSGSVLVLNQNYEPLNVCSWKRAVILIFLGKAEIIEKNDHTLRSLNWSTPCPSVVRLFIYVKNNRKKVVLNKKNILKRDNFTCQYCGKQNVVLTIDHIIPKDMGGKDEWENLVCACTDCNGKKSNRTPESANMTLKKVPRAPNYLFYFQNYMGIKDERWKPYLFLH